MQGGLPLCLWFNVAHPFFPLSLVRLFLPSSLLSCFPSSYHLFTRSSTNWGHGCRIWRTFSEQKKKVVGNHLFRYSPFHSHSGTTVHRYPLLHACHLTQESLELNERALGRHINVQWASPFRSPASLCVYTCVCHWTVLSLIWCSWLSLYIPGESDVVGERERRDLMDGCTRFSSVFGSGCHLFFIFFFSRSPLLSFSFFFLSV